MARRLWMVALLAIGCGAELEPLAEDAADAPFGGKADDGVSTPGVLRVANETTQEELQEIGLTVTAASNIVAYRRGADGVEGTGDDETYDTLGELDDIPYVGPRSLERLVEEARRRGYLDPSGVAMRCVNGSRSFAVERGTSRLEGVFQDFTGRPRRFACVEWQRGAIEYRCYGDAENPPFEQINVMRNASGDAQVEFNLVSTANEEGGGDYLFSFLCEEGSTLDF